MCTTMLLGAMFTDNEPYKYLFMNDNGPSSLSISIVIAITKRSYLVSSY